LGVLLFEGVITANYNKIFSGAVAVTVLSLTANYGIRTIERRAERSIHGAQVNH
jgi:ABC-type proline/glycine betaine transport system permease subunit